VADYVLLATAVAGLLLSAFKDRKKTKRALLVGAKQFRNVLPFFVAIFAAIGLLQAWVTSAQVQAVLGSDRGVFAPVLAAVIGGLATGPPAAVFPLGKQLLAQHASTGAVATLLVAWVAVGTVTLPAEIRYFGSRFAMTRWALTLVLSVALGMVMGWIL